MSSQSIDGAVLNKTPLVSIIVPTFNSARYLPRCLKALANQTYKNIEVVIVDAGSTDNSEEIINRYRAVLNIKTFTFLKSTQSQARNLGLEHAKGEYVGFCDSDDFYLSEKIARQIDRLETLHTDVCYFDVLHFYTDNTKRFFINQHPTSKDVLADCIQNQIINLNSVLINRNFLLKHNLYFPCDEMGRYGEDGNFIFQLALHGATFSKLSQAYSVVEVRKDSHTQWEAQWKMKKCAIQYLTEAKNHIQEAYIPLIDHAVKNLKFKLAISLLIIGNFKEAKIQLLEISNMPKKIGIRFAFTLLSLLPKNLIKHALTFTWNRIRKSAREIWPLLDDRLKTEIHSLIIIE